MTSTLAVATAKRAFKDWSRTDVEKRAAILAKAAELIRENANGLAATLTSEQGKPIAEAMGEVTHLVHGVHYYAEAATKTGARTRSSSSTLGPAYGMVIRRPMGVCAAITPYNFPLTLLGTKVAPALAYRQHRRGQAGGDDAAGHAEVARLFAEAGVPDGVLNVVTGRGSDIGDALVSHPDVSRVAFTGSTAVGRHVAELAAHDLKRLTLELGGSDPVIICDDADVDAAVKAVIIGRYWNAGQACLGCKRVFVHDSVYDDFVTPARRSGRKIRAGRRHDQTREAEAPHGPDPHRNRPRRAARADRGAIGRRRGADRRQDRRQRQGLVPRAGGDRGAGGGLAASCARRCSGRSCPVSRYTDFDDAIDPGQRHAVRPRARRSGRTTPA